MLAKLEVKNCLQELREVYFVANDLGRLERVGSSSLFGLGVPTLLSTVGSILRCKVEAALGCLGWLGGAKKAEIRRQDLNITRLIHVLDYLLPNRLLH